jgi:uncharacterized membrane protein
LSDASLLFLAFGIGFAAGLRSLTAPAAVSWAAYLGSLNLWGSSLAFMASGIAVTILSTLAVVEYVTDKLPTTPSRTTLGPLMARIVMGAFTGACLAISAGQALLTGAIPGAIGGLTGAFAGYEGRRRLVQTLKVKDAPIALLEDLLAIGLACLILFRR